MHAPDPSAVPAAVVRRRRRSSPARVLVFVFAAFILAGTLLLWLPVSAARAPISLLDAFFTSTSAVCVTGLIVLDTPNDLSLIGQVIVLLLIQIGGLGYMVISTIIGVALGRQLSVHERLTLQEALNVQTMEDLVRFALTVLKLTLAFELTGAAVLTAWWAGELGLARASYHGVFHAISAFNNAGFALFSDNLIRYRGDWVVNLVITTLIICGGLGFMVLTEIGRVRRFRGLSSHARLVLILTAILLVGGTVLFWSIERANARTLGQLGFGESVLAAWFQSVTARTAGFNTIDIGAMLPASLFIMIILMFIGAAPGGTGGGVKLTTFGIAIAVIWAMIRGRTEPTLLRRRIPPALVARTFTICLIAFLAVNLVAGILLIREGRILLLTLFETTSAFGTVGLSTGMPGSPLSLAGHFSPASKLLLAAMMFMGRVGPLTLAVAVAHGGKQARVRYPLGKFQVG